MKNLKLKENSKEFDKEKIRQLFFKYAESRDEKIKERLVLYHINLVRYLASRFASRGESFEDLVQIGCVGLIKAIDRFDVNKGSEFTTYATPTIVGEVKRYFRDNGWAFKVPRRLQELNMGVNKTVEQLSSNLGRSPTITEIAEKLRVSEEEVLEAQELGQVYIPISLDSEVESYPENKYVNLLDYLGKEDPRFENLEDRISIEKAFSKLEKREQIVLYLRFYKNMSQNEIARHLRMLQMNVSRLQNRALEKLKIYLSGK